MSLEEFERRTAAPYIHTETPSVEMAPGEKTAVRFTIAIPSGGSGEYFALIRADPGPSPTVSQQSVGRRVRLTLQVGAFVYVTAGTREPTDEDGRDLNLRVFRVPPATFNVEVADVRAEFPAPDSERQTLRVVATVANRGNVHFRAHVAGILRNVDTRRTI
jgi:hypothetical protein